MRKHIIGKQVIVFLDSEPGLIEYVSGTVDEVDSLTNIYLSDATYVVENTSGEKIKEIHVDKIVVRGSKVKIVLA